MASVNCYTRAYQFRYIFVHFFFFFHSTATRLWFIHICNGNSCIFPVRISIEGAVDMNCVLFAWKEFLPQKKKTNKNYVEGKHQHESSEMFGWKLLGGHGAPHEREKQRRANYPSEKQSPICLRETKGKNCAHAHTNASKLITSKIYRMNNQTARLSNALSTRFRKKRKKKKTNKIIILM